jgi:hypothetical protein
LVGQLDLCIYIYREREKKYIGASIYIRTLKQPEHICFMIMISLVAPLTWWGEGMWTGVWGCGTGGSLVFTGW